MTRALTGHVLTELRVRLCQAAPRTPAPAHQATRASSARTSTPAIAVPARMVPLANQTETTTYASVPYSTLELTAKHVIFLQIFFKRVCKLV